MPMWLRAIIFSLEFIGFIILCVFATNKFYKKDLEETTEIDANKKRKENITYFFVNFAIILSLFLFTYPSYVFLSYSKMILVTIAIIISSVLIVIIIFGDDTNFVQQSALLIVMSMLTVAAIIGAGSGYFSVDDEIIYEENKQPKIITPLMFEENKVGYSCDENGNIEKYYFYYIENDELFFEQLKPSEVNVIDLKDKDTYIEKQETKIVHLKKEKKETEADYSYTEIDASYKIYLNKKQMTEIKTNH